MENYKMLDELLDRMIINKYVKVLKETSIIFLLHIYEKRIPTTMIEIKQEKGFNLFKMAYVH